MTLLSNISKIGNPSSSFGNDILASGSMDQTTTGENEISWNGGGGGSWRGGGGSWRGGGWNDGWRGGSGSWRGGGGSWRGGNWRW